jgi:DNA-binding CsgD family transcriptional regulator
VASRAARLTDRERQILQRVANGDSNVDIAAALVLSVHTVHTHVRNLLTKLDFHSKLQAVAWAVKAGIVTVQR